MTRTTKRLWAYKQVAETWNAMPKTDRVEIFEDLGVSDSNYAVSFERLETETRLALIDDFLAAMK